MKIIRQLSTLLFLSALFIIYGSISAEGLKPYDNGSEHVGDQIQNDKTRSGNQALHEEPALIGPDLEAEFQSAVAWMSGYAFSAGQAFGNSVAKAVDVFGSNLDVHDYVPVEIRFSSTETTLCQTFRRDQSYNSAGVGLFPGTAWDMSDPGNPRQLNLCFVEDDSLGTPNLQWDPSGAGYAKREYLFVMTSDYDGTGLTYAGENILSNGDNLDVYYFWWPRLASGHTLLETLPATLTITPYYVTNLVGVPQSGSITVAWSYHNTPDSYILYGGTTNPPATVISTPDSTENRFLHSGLTDGLTYYYRVEAIEGGEVIDASRILTATPQNMGNNVTLVDFWHGRGVYGDVWGYTDPLGGEYALICARNQGISIIDLSTTPLTEISFIPSTIPGRDAKDVKIYKNYAIIIHEYYDAQIVDISDIANPVTISHIYPDGGGAHNCLVDGDYLYIIGNHGAGGLEIFDISNPAVPIEVGGMQPFYYHDVDVQGDTLIGVGIYGEGVDIIDISNKAAPVLLKRFNYSGSGAHNVEFSADGMTVFIGDEIGSAGNHTRVFDISNLSSITKIADIIVDPLAVTHNCYQKDQKLYIAHYTEGLRVWDISDPANPTEEAYYDTYPPADYGYLGAWSVYPYFESGKIAISDMQSGLYIFTLDLEPPSCCGQYTSGYSGNTNCDTDGKRNLADITRLIDNVYISKEALCCSENGNVNGDTESKVNLADITKLIDHVYISKGETATCE